MFPIEEFQRTMAQYRIFLVNPDHFPMEIDELLILSSPGVSSPVVRIGEATESCLVSIIKGRRAGPGHLHGHSLPHNGDIDLLLRRLIAELGHSSHPMVGPGQETGVVMVGQFVHGHLQRRSHKAAHMVAHRSHEGLMISQKVATEIIAVFLHSGQKPGQRFHESVIVHHGIPLVSLEPGTGLPVMLRQNDGLGIGLFDIFPEFLPEFMVVLVAEA